MLCWCQRSVETGQDDSSWKEVNILAYYICRTLTKNIEDWKKSFLVLWICYNVCLQGTEFGINMMDALSYPLLPQRFRLIMVWRTLGTHLAPSYQQSNTTHSHKSKIISNWFLDYGDKMSNDLHTLKISIQYSTFGIWWKKRFTLSMWNPQKIGSNCMIIPSPCYKICHKELRQNES